jgi:predicted nucleotidyltransferase
MRENLHYHDIEISKEKVAAFCRRWKIKELSFFGSILRTDFRPESDIDVLVSFAPDTRWTFDDHMAMKEELEAMLGHPVDLVEKQLVEQSKNYIRRKHILSHAEAVYVA